jgi:CDP-diacylglycerol--glycerol-3-phosphate 3-phosphatidyltransferase
MLFIIFPILSDTPSRIVSLILFLLTASTDFLDGYIARKYNLVTDFGKFLDPIADKLMIFGACIGIMVLYRANLTFLMFFSVSTFIVIFREIAVTSLRMVVSSSNNIVIAANYLGKIKTVSQIICVSVILIEPILQNSMIFSYITTVIMTLATMVSGINYYIAYLPYLDTEK